MSAKNWFLLSLGANAVLVGILAYQHVHESPESVAAPARPPSVTVTNTRPVVVVRRQNFTWQEVESGDYGTYINNLRDIGTPEQTIRDIIIADVNQLYAHKRATEIINSRQQWWKSTSDPAVDQRALEKEQSLETERRALLTRLLGPDWDPAGSQVAAAPTSSGITLTGPLLGELPDETKAKVYDIAERAQQKINNYTLRTAEDGAQPDFAELARLRQQTRAELAQVLNPAQLEEFLLRYSKTAQDLRTEVNGLNLSPDQFRALFRVRDSSEPQLDQFYTGTSARTAQERQSLEARNEIAIKDSLGPELYQAYVLNRDPVYQQTKVVASQLGVPEKDIAPVYQISQVVDQERSRILANQSLTPEEKQAALVDIESEEVQSLEKILGPDLSRRYLRRRNP